MNQQDAIDFLHSGEPFKKKRFTDEQQALSFLKGEKPIPKETPETSFLKPAWRTTGSVGRIYPALEAAVTAGSMIYGLPISGSVGLAGGLVPAKPELKEGMTILEQRRKTGPPKGFDIKKAAKAQEIASKALIYEPKTKRGKELTGSLFYPFEKLSQVGEVSGDYVLEKTGSPEAAAITKSAIESLPVLIPLMKKAGGRLIKSKPPTPKQPIIATPETEVIKTEFAKKFLKGEEETFDLVKIAEENEKALEKFRNQKTHIPKFRNSQEAINFGRQARANTKLANQLSEMETRSRELSTRYREANESQKAMDASTDAQFYREALEAQRGEIKEPGKIEKAEAAKFEAGMEAERKAVEGFKKPKAKKFKESENLLAAIRRRGGLSTQEFKGEYKGAPGYVKLLRRRKGGMAIGDMDKIIKEERPDLLGPQDNLRDILFGDPERLKRKGYGKLVEMEEFKKQLEPPEVEYSKEQEAKDLKELEKYFAEQGKKAEKPRLAKPEIEKATEKGPTLYSGIPLPEFKKLRDVWTKNIGEPIWDKLIMQKVPKMLEKVPGGKSINRAFLYEYRGNLPKTAEYIKTMEEMRENQSIAREYAIDLGQRLQSGDEATQLKIGEAIRGEIELEKLSESEKTLALESKNVMYDLGRQAVDTGLLSEQTFFKNAGRYMPRLYTSKEYQSLLTKYNLTKPNRLDLSRFKQRKDIPKAIREKMGEILTPGYPVAKGIIQLTHDIQVAKFFNGIAKNPEWAWTGRINPEILADIKSEYKSFKKQAKGDIQEALQNIKDEWPQYEFTLTKKNRIKIQTKKPIPKDFKKLPSNKKLGSLSEAYVHPEIFKDIQETIRVMETPEKVWRKSLGYWKFGKVIISPKTHSRNLMSNSVLAHLGGLPMYEQPVYLARAAKEMRSKGKYWQEAKKAGLLRYTFTNAELRMLFDQVESRLSGIKAGSIPEAMGKIGRLWQHSKAGMGKAAKLYEAEEQWFKMAKFIHNIERNKMKFSAAAKDAEKWLFNYAKVTKFQEKYRSRWYGAPFATFTFKALPRIAEAAIKTPWRFALPASMIYSLEFAAQKMIGDTREQIKAKKELRPEWQHGTFLGIVPNFARFPFVDEYGREHYLNLTYILPWGDLAEGGDVFGIPGALRPFSQPFVNVLFEQIANYNIFYKEPIVKESELAGKTKIGKLEVQAKERGKHLFQALAPTPAIDVAKGVSTLIGKPDYRGRLRAPGVVAADVFAGVKLYPVDYANELIKRISKINPQNGALAQEIKADIKRLSIKRKAMADRGKSTTSYDKQIQSKIDQLVGLARETKKTGKLFKKTK